MTDKIAYYAALAEEASTQVTANIDNWTAFLSTAGRLYKYPYNEQLMIHAQRSDATACAEYGLWNKKMHRYVKRGAKGIALLDSSGDNPKIRYVFDVSDTGKRHDSKDVTPWRINRKNYYHVQEDLELYFGVNALGNTFENQIDDISEKLADEYWSEHNNQIIHILADNSVQKYDKSEMEIFFKNAASASIAYTIYSRCFRNPDSYFENEDFLDVFRFNTKDTANMLGTAVSESSEKVFREIERSIRSFEQEKEERNESYENIINLQTEWRLSDTEPEVITDRTEAPGQIWQNEESISEGEQFDSVQQPDTQREAVSASQGDRRNSQSENGISDEGISEAESGTEQGEKSDGMGSAYEQPEIHGGGNYYEGAGEQLSFFSTQQEQISNIDEAESKISAFSFSQNDMDTVLKFGLNDSENRMTVALEYMKQKPLFQIENTLREVYTGGFGLKLDDKNIAVWYGKEGIYLDKGNSAEYSNSSKLIPWEDAAQRIGELLEKGEYATNVELEEAHSRETEKLAQSFWYLYHDLSEEAISRNLLPTLKQTDAKGFPEETSQLAEYLSNTGFVSELRDDYQHFLNELENDSTLLRFHYHNLDDMEERLYELDMPLREYHSDMIQLPVMRQFITDDEINHALSTRSSLSGGRQRIYEYWQENHSRQEQAEFLKNEYGTGGYFPALSGAPHSGHEYDSKGMTFTKDGCEAVNLTWSQVASRIDDLIRKNRYTEKAEPEKQEPDYHAGDTVYLDDTAFRIEEVTDRDVKLLDTSLVYPVIRVENRAVFEEMISDKNAGDIPAVNFHITDEHIGEGGAKEKFRNNMSAINLLKKLEDRNATSDEQEILSKYVGWGGLADAFDENKSSWASEFKELESALSTEEYEAARASTLNAHYTSPMVISAIYDAVQKLGFESGNILEPAMGIGNFFGMLPDNMRNSNLYGVELDTISGRIAQKLYPNADIKIAGFETTDRRDFYDLAIGNVPFGNYRVSDKPYDKLGFSIHNYFFAKALDQVRPGGVIAFVTSRFTMDSKNSDARRYIAQRAELLGAVRLPNDTFKKNAGAEVVSDIIFLQKRDHPLDIEPEWVNLGTDADGFTMNSYFVNHPEMIMGDLSLETTPYGKEELTVLPRENTSLSELLKDAVNNIHGTYKAAEISEDELMEEQNVIPASPDVKNFSYTVYEDEVYFRENSIMRQVELNDKSKNRIKGMIELREIVNRLINYQLEDYPDEKIKETQAELNTAYDRFSKENGLINSRNNSQVFSDDSSYYLLCSLENIDEDGNLKSKADMFTKRTIKPQRVITSADTPSEALAISMGERGKIDLPYMAQLLGTPDDFDNIISALKGVIFKNPMASQDIAEGWETADEYLSGDVRSKLHIAQIAAENNPEFEVNAEALLKAQPKDLDASEIDIRLGATWIDPQYIQQFMEETFEMPYYLSNLIEVKYSELTAEWRITGKTAPSRNDVAAYTTYGTERANAYRILEETLNLKDIRIYDTIEDEEGKQKRILNKKQTTLAGQKQQAIKDAFVDWIWKNPQRRENLVNKYNVMFNSTRPREYDGSHITFAGMNPEITLREHQRNAIAHVLYGGNTLLAHEVGAGKTFEMAASAMESKRLGLCQKSLFVVPNHLTMQWANEFLNLYPSAKLLVATKKDFETANRKKFCARIATGDYDAVIIGHSQFEKIPISPERQERLLREQIDEIENALAELKFSRGENFSIKQMEKTKKSLEARLDKLTSTDRKDDVITFEQLGVDRLFVDESHAFKNLFLYTKMRNVAGLSTSEAQKSSDMFMKCRYMDELTGGRGVVFATGTPISNSMTELYTVMRYLQYGTLQKKNLTHFDCWASTFGETTTAIELAPEGYTGVGW